MDSKHIFSFIGQTLGDRGGAQERKAEKQSEREAQEDGALERSRKGKQEEKDEK